MYRQIDNAGYPNGLAPLGRESTAIAQSGELEALIALERIGTRLTYSRNDEVYAEGDAADCWYKVVSGTVRVCKLLADGRRHIAVFCFSGDCFGIDYMDHRSYSAEAVENAVIMRYRRSATEQLTEQNAALGRFLRDAMGRDLAEARGRTVLLGRLTAPERVAAFLLEMFERRERTRLLDLPMSRNDVADYLGLTVETVCRVLSSFKREGIIAISDPHRIELLDREALEAAAEAC
jgi:CRP/FNR family transcriptional regulator, nitrogen fixation regulation protein